MAQAIKLTNHKFPLPDRTGEQVLFNGQLATIVGKGTCAYLIQYGDVIEPRSAFELEYFVEPHQLNLF